MNLPKSAKNLQPNYLPRADFTFFSNFFKNISIIFCFILDLVSQ